MRREAQTATPAAWCADKQSSRRNHKQQPARQRDGAPLPGERPPPEEPPEARSSRLLTLTVTFPHLGRGTEPGSCQGRGRLLSCCPGRDAQAGLCRGHGDDVESQEPGEERASGGSSGEGLSPGRGRPVLLGGGGPSPSVAFRGLFVGPPRCWGCRSDFPSCRRPQEPHRPDSVKSGPSRPVFRPAVPAARLDPARPARLAMPRRHDGKSEQAGRVQKQKAPGARRVVALVRPLAVRPQRNCTRGVAVGRPGLTAGGPAVGAPHQGCSAGAQAQRPTTENTAPRGDPTHTPVSRAAKGAGPL